MARRYQTKQIHKAGFEFDDWYLGNVLYSFDTAVKSSFTLTAKYEEVPVDAVKYTVTFNTVGSNAVAAVEVVSGQKIKNLQQSQTSI